MNFYNLQEAYIKVYDGRTVPNCVPKEEFEIEEAKKEKTLRNTNPCWKGYEPIGTKKKNGRTVPNCVPKEEFEIEEAKKEKTLKNTNPCWKGYEPIGTKKKNGRTVPNCVPKEEFELDERHMTADEKAKEEKLGENTKSAKVSMMKQYGHKKGEKIYYAWKRKQAMKEMYNETYDYIIESLVQHDYAADYNSAEEMVEVLSDDFLRYAFEEYIKEATLSTAERRAANAGKKGYDSQGKPLPKQSNTHVMHDGDDNVAGHRHPNAAKIDLYKKNSDSSHTHVKSMTPSEFAHTPLPRRHEYGFDEFRSSKKFKDTTSPNRNITRIGDSRKRKAKKSVVTARGGSAFGSNKPSTPMDDPGSFVSDLRDRIGVKGLKRKDTHFTGGMSKGSNKGLSGPEKKAKVVSKIVKPSDKKIITTDDHLGNTRAMAAAASAAAPQAKVIAYQSRPATKARGKVKPGDIVPVRVGKENNLNSTNIGIRPNSGAPKSTKEKQNIRRKMREEMTAYEYWKQFINE